MVTAAKANAPWAFERLFEALASPLVGYLRAQGVEDPDGLANEVFLRVFLHLRGFEGTEPAFRSWVFTIAYHRVVDERRRASRRPRAGPLLGDDSDRPGGDVEDAAMEDLGEEWVRRLLARLVPDQRDVLLLRVLGDLTVEDVADALGKSPGAVKALQRRALGALRRSFDEEGVPR